MNKFGGDTWVFDEDAELVLELYSIQKEAYALFKLLEYTDYLSSLEGIEFEGNTNVDITCFAKLVYSYWQKVKRKSHASCWAIQIGEKIFMNFLSLFMFLFKFKILFWISIIFSIINF